MGFIRQPERGIVVEVVQESVGIADVVLLQQVCRIAQANALREGNGYRQGAVHGVADQFTEDGFIRHVRTKLVVAGLDVLVLVAHASNKDKETGLGNDVLFLERLRNVVHGSTLGDGDDLGGAVAVDAQQISAVDDEQGGEQDRHGDDDNSHDQRTDDTVGLAFPAGADGSAAAAGAGLALALQILVQRVSGFRRLRRCGVPCAGELLRSGRAAEAPAGLCRRPGGSWLRFCRRRCRLCCR